MLVGEEYICKAIDEAMLEQVLVARIATLRVHGSVRLICPRLRLQGLMTNSPPF